MEKTEKTLKLLIFTEWERDWDIENVVGSPESAYVFDALKRVGFDLTIVAPSQREGHEYSKEGYQIHFIHKTNLWRPPFVKLFAEIVEYVILNQRFYKRSLDILNIDRFDGILSFGKTLAPAAYRLSKKAHIPALIKVPGVVFLNRRMSKIKHVLFNWPFILAFRIPFERYLIVDDGSEGDIAAIRLGVPREKILFLPNPAPTLHNDIPKQHLKSSLGIHSGVPLVGWAGRMDPLKGISHLISVVKKVARAHNETHFLFIGSGPLFKKLTESLKYLDGRTHFTGSLPYKRAKEIIGAADIFVSTNIYANYTLPVLEAMAHGIPVVTWNIGGTSKAVLDGVTGYLIAPWDTESMAERVVFLLENPEKRVQMGEKAKEHLKGFPTWEERAMDEAKAIRSTIEEWKRRFVT